MPHGWTHSKEAMGQQRSPCETVPKRCAVRSETSGKWYQAMRGMPFGLSGLHQRRASSFCDVSCPVISWLKLTVSVQFSINSDGS